MKAYAMIKLGEVGWIDVEKPKPGPIDAIIRPLAVGMCTSDMHSVYEGGLGERYNMILGHEAVGEVVEIGSEVKDFKVGDRISVGAITPDWRTIDIQRGWQQHSGGMLQGFAFPNKGGVFAEYFHVNDADMNLAHLPKEIPLETAVMTCDMMPTGFHGVELADVELGMTVCVIGIGPVGLMAVAGARLSGAGRLFAVGSRPVCVEAAKYYGATDIVNYKHGDIAEQIMKLTDGVGVDATIVAGGEKGGEGLSQAIKITKPGGTIGNVAYFTDSILPIPCLEWGLGMSNKTIRGGLMPAGRLKIGRWIDMIRYNRVDPSKLATHVFHGVENMDKAWNVMRDKPNDLIKSVLIF